MKTISKIIILLIFFSAASCRKDYFGQKPIPPGPVYFSKQIVPILTTNCAKSGCHVTGGQSPNLAAAVAYDNLTGLGFATPDDSLKPESSLLYKQMISASKPMPPNGKLSSYDTQLILLWIKQGAQNN